mmetsp:Transcript_10690/g.45546  ORF Transcript_10690/g.45546 Transcript_10690/m.45546 type:complete len:245 (+) Transcript_10690:120-854(+)
MRSPAGDHATALTNKPGLGSAADSGPYPSAPPTVPYPSENAAVTASDCVAMGDGTLLLNSRTVLSSEPHAMRPPRETSRPMKLRRLTCPRNVRTHGSHAEERLSKPFVTSHSFRVLSVDAVTSWCAPSQRTYDTARLCPESTTKGRAVRRKSYTCVLCSAELNATTLALTGENCTEHTFARHRIVAVDALCVVDQTRTVPSSDPDASRVGSSVEKSKLHTRFSCSRRSPVEEPKSASHSRIAPS